MTTDAITPDVLLSAYAQGFFPMAPDAASADLDWFNPDPRGILPLDGLHLPRRLQKQLRQHRHKVTLDQNFAGVIRGCAEARPSTWINQEIQNLYCALFKRGVAHSCEVWNEDRLVGGIYGLSLGGAFFGESMFSVERDASKIALAHILARLRGAGYVLFDTQFINPHLLQFGAVEIPRAEYLHRLKKAIQLSVNFYSGFSSAAGSAGLGASSGWGSAENTALSSELDLLLHSITQTS